MLPISETGKYPRLRIRAFGLSDSNFYGTRFSAALEIKVDGH